MIEKYSNEKLLAMEMKISLNQTVKQLVFFEKNCQSEGCDNE